MLQELISTNRAEIVLEDGTSGSPVELVIPCDGADLSVSGLPPGDGDHEIEIFQSRGEICALIPGDRTIPTLSLTAHLAAFTSSSAGNVADFLRRTGSYTANKSTLGDGKPYTVHATIRWVSEETGATHSWRFEDCLMRLAGMTEGRPAAFQLEGQILGSNTRSMTPAA